MAIFLPCRAQERNAVSDSLITIADNLRKSYDFLEAISTYRYAIEAEADTTLHSSIQEKLFLAENGANMMDYVYIPNVISKRTFSLESFFLYYPLPDKSWHPVVDSLNVNPYAQVIYFEQGEEPEEEINQNEIYPLLSEDGRSFYFASKDEYGIGGYDLYVKQWNSKTRSWGPATNLGLPFSSPYDDMLYMDTEDGKYTIFASNRECAKDSMTVYVLEHDSLPIHEKITETERLRNIMSLVPQKKEQADIQQVEYESEAVKEYVEKSVAIKSLKAEIYSNYNESLIDSLSTLNKQIQQLEMELLMQGVVVDLDKYEAHQSSEKATSSVEFQFVEMTLGEPYTPPAPPEPEPAPAPVKKKK